MVVFQVVVWALHCSDELLPFTHSETYGSSPHGTLICWVEELRPELIQIVYTCLVTRGTWDLVHGITVWTHMDGIRQCGGRRREWTSH